MKRVFSSLMLGSWLCLAISSSLSSANAGQMTFQVQLIWGTNGDKPNDPKLLEVDPKLRAKLMDVLQWKNYYEVASKPLAVADSSSNKLRLSDKCEIEVKNLGAAKVEIQLIGEGNPYAKVTQKAVPGEPIVIGSHDKNRTAWLAVVTPKK